MKISLITSSNNEIISSEKNDTVKLISSLLYKNGFDVVLNQVIKCKSEVVSNCFNKALELSDCVIFICDNEFEKSYMAKKIIADSMQTKLVVNNYAKKNIEEFCSLKNVPIKKEDSGFYQLPEIARCIKNPNSVFQGFLIEKEDKMVFFLPLFHAELHHMFFTSVLPYIIQKYKDKTNSSYVFKTFGLKINEMNLLLKDLIKNKHGVEIVCNEYLLNGEILVSVPTKARHDIVTNLIQTLYAKILPYVYSDTDSNYPELIESILSITNKKIVFAEDFTAGKMVNTFYSTLPKAKDLLIEAYFTPTNHSKTKILGVEQSIFNKPTIDHEEIAYQMALGALENSGADIVVSNCGELESGKVTFAIGSSEGIHIYHQEVTGTYEQKIDMACNSIFFQLIKKIRQNDFHLGSTVI